tara:strand:- start:1680 stop:2228 length:549 start_codon:yes stop_codon:yes gene_type:complete
MKNIVILFIVVSSLLGCGTSNFSKEIIEVDALLSLVDETEKMLLSIDTSRVFATKKRMEIDYKEFTQYSDTLSREEAFRFDDIFGSKKKIFRTAKSYEAFINEIDNSKIQLNNLKTDLENGLVKKEQYLSYYESEKKAYEGLIHQINKAIGNFDVAISKYELERPELLELIEKRRIRAAKNE